MSGAWQVFFPKWDRKQAAQKKIVLVSGKLLKAKEIAFVSEILHSDVSVWKQAWRLVK